MTKSILNQVKHQKEVWNFKTNMSSKKLVFLSVFLFSALVFSCTQKETPTFSISGNIKNFHKDKVTLSLEEDINRKQNRVIGEIPIDTNGNFKMDFNLEPHIYTLNFDDKKKVMLAVDKGRQIVINGDANDWSTLKVSGSPDTAKLEEYEAFRKKSLDELVNSVRDKIKLLKENNDPANDAEIAKLGALEIENYDKHKDELIDFVKNKMGTSIAVYPTSLRWDGDKNVPVLENIAAEFEKAHPNLAVTQKINEKVKTLKNTSVGGTVTEINLPDKDGNKIALSSLKGKYILIDFWASWCPPCRRESKILAELSQKYNKEGFEIYGVSLDEDKDAWLKAIEMDERIWSNVSTLQGFETPVTFDYAVTSLPAKFIIDSNGKIVAKNLHGEELRKKIESLF
ncbi:TlpA disulfide reductase family protein [soil metagenome]